MSTTLICNIIKIILLVNCPSYDEVFNYLLIRQKKQNSVTGNAPIIANDNQIGVSRPISARDFLFLSVCVMCPIYNRCEFITQNRQWLFSYVILTFPMQSSNYSVLILSVFFFCMQHVHTEKRLCMLLLECMSCNFSNLSRGCKMA